VVMAYGNPHARCADVVGGVLRGIAETGRPLKCLGVNKGGSAKHLLYPRNDTAPMEFPTRSLTLYRV